MTKYALAYRLGIRPWERYRTAAADSIGALLDREEAERSRPPGRALDLGCGRGLYTVELARRGWTAVGVDAVPRAIDAAQHADTTARFVVGDVTGLSPDLGTFDFFLDVGCFQGLTAEQRRGEGDGVTARANPGATFLLMVFGPTPVKGLVGGVAKDDVAAAFPDWQIDSVQPAATAGLGWPLSRTDPQWYRLRRPR
jgi:SAM-dependent methyltransferase